VGLSVPMPNQGWRDAPVDDDDTHVTAWALRDDSKGGGQEGRDNVGCWKWTWRPVVCLKCTDATDSDTDIVPVKLFLFSITSCQLD
jgi:hypothetical protein